MDTATCTPVEEAKTVWNCRKCYPRLCSCPLTREEKIEARIICLSENVWTDQEKAGFRHELAKMMPTTDRRRRLLASLEGDSFSPMEKKRLQRELDLLSLDLKQTDYRTSSEVPYGR